MVKNLLANAGDRGDVGSILGLERCPVEGFNMNSYLVGSLPAVVF